MKISHAFVCGVLLSGFFAASALAAGDADEKPSWFNNGRVALTEENDFFTASGDKHYTQGAKLSYTSGPVTPDDGWDRPFQWMGGLLPIFSGSDRTRKYDWTIAGQSIFTPTNLLSAAPTTKDRPYAAWLYTGVGFLQETRQKSYDTLEDLEILGGVVGPAALGGVTQNDFHQFIDVHTAVGWQNQLHNEPGFILSYERKWRFEQPIAGNFAIDAIPEAGVSGGNVLTYGDIGGMVRVGQNLRADYGPNRIRPNVSGTGWFNGDRLDGDFGWYMFAATQGRVVGHNIFLDGNTMSASPSVDKKPLVADFTGGVSLFWSSAVRVDFTATQRTKEFYGQANEDRFGGIGLVVRL